MGRCSSCKEDTGSYPRHKFSQNGVSMVLCESCLQRATGRSVGCGFWGRVKDWFQDIWKYIVRPPTRKEASHRTMMKSDYKRMKMALPDYTQKNPHHLR